MFSKLDPFFKPDSGLVCHCSVSSANSTVSWIFKGNRKNENTYGNKWKTTFCYKPGLGTHGRDHSLLAQLSIPTVFLLSLTPTNFCVSRCSFVVFHVFLAFLIFPSRFRSGLPLFRLFSIFHCQLDLQGKTQQTYANTRRKTRKNAPYDHHRKNRKSSFCIGATQHPFCFSIISPPTNLKHICGVGVFAMVHSCFAI